MSLIVTNSSSNSPGTITVALASLGSTNLSKAEQSGGPACR